MPTAQVNIVAVGQAALTLRTTVAALNTAAAALGIVPAMTINGVPFLDADDVDRLADHLRATKPK